MAAISRKEYEDRRRRQSEGITREKAEGKFRGEGGSHPDTGADSTPAGVVKSVREWRAANGKPGFKS